MKRFALLLVLVVGCSKTTEPAAPWYDGQWQLATVDGKAVPAFVDIAGPTRFDEMHLTVLTPTDAGFGYSFAALRPDGTVFATIGCSAFVGASVRGDTIEVYQNSATNSTCTFSNLDGRKFARSGSELVHQWSGHRYVLRK